jgi:predicted metal-dependent HD superfamily phosphohydrolase
LNTPLKPHWFQLLSGLGATADECRRTFADLAARYASAGRHYHTLGHVGAVLRTLAELGAEEASQPALFLAAWFHDAVYDSQAKDNEEQSASLAVANLRPLRLPEPVLEETARLVLLTKTHQAAPDDAPGHLLLDADLAILGAGEADYDAYARAIRREYDWVPEDLYREGRRRVLEGFLARPRLYFTPVLGARLEEQARRNLRREIAALGGPGERTASG